MSNVVDVVVANQKLATMSRSVKAVGLDTVLSRKGPFTIFAPTDVAFAKMNAGKMDNLMKFENCQHLTDLLKHHVVEGITNFDDLTDDQKLVTINGLELTVKVTADKVTINGAMLENMGNKGTNGVVHLLDTVIELN